LWAIGLQKSHYLVLDMTDNIVRIPDEIRNEFKINADGKAFVSIRGAARLAGINDKTLGDSLKTSAGIKSVKNDETLSEQRVEGAGIKLSKLAQSLIDAGFEPGDFFQTGVLDIVLSVLPKCV